MDKETANYIITYFSNLLTEREAMARRHSLSMVKLGSASLNDPRRKLYKEKNWITDNPAVLKLIRNGYDAFEITTAKRILQESGDSVYLNKCPNCAKLARTPQARQCRHCGYSWHNVIVAKFRLEGSFQIKGRPFFITGSITEGEVKKGDLIDLTMIGLNSRPEIVAVESVLLRTTLGTRRGNTALGAVGLSEGEKEYLKNYGSHGTPFDIISGDETNITKSISSSRT